MANLSVTELASVDGSLDVYDNAALQVVSMPKLKTVGGSLEIFNNTALKLIDGFPNLTDITGSFSCFGNFTDVQMPQLRDVGKTFTLQSSENISSTCSQFEPLLDHKRGIEGVFFCNGKEERYHPTATQSRHAQPTSSKSQSTQQSSAAPDGVSSGTKTGVGVGVGIGVALLAACLGAFVFRRRRQRKKSSTEPHLEKDGTELDRAAMLGNGGQRTELEQPPEQMPLGNEAQELPGEHGKSELPHHESDRIQNIDSRHELPAS